VLIFSVLEAIVEGLRVCVLASGSTGNSVYVSSGAHAILIDAGISARALGGRLADIGVDPASLDGICISHEHDDHVRALRVFHRRHRVPLYGNAGTIEAIRRNPAWRELPWQVFTTGSPFTVGDLRIETFLVPHDAYEPVGFVVSRGGRRIGIATDLGTPTHLIRERLRDCRLLVVEANHDDRMLEEAPRPWQLKQRIRGRQGHLSNERAAGMVAEIAGPNLERVVLAHLSRDCNREHLALRAVEAGLAGCGHCHVQVSVASPDRVSEVWTC
jgi:phosphoribosyl 1,2-cyclic phosphodiesterase